MTMMPYVVVHNAVSLDGALDWLVPEWPKFNELLSTYYSRAAAFEEDATLCGSETILKAFEWDEGILEDAPAAPFEPADGDSRPLLVIPDSRGRVRIWRWLLSQPYWRAGVALCSDSTPADYLEYLDSQGIDHIVAGSGCVDLRAALLELNARFGVDRLRVDSGGVLNGVLLSAGLVNEVSLMLVPVLVGRETHSSLFRAPSGGGLSDLVDVRLKSVEQLEKDMLWLRYDVLSNPLT